MDRSSAIIIASLSDTELREATAELGELLLTCVANGAAINFVMPFAPQDAEGFWTRKVLPGVAAGKRVVLVARVGERIAGTVQLDTDTPPNQPHRADVAKLMVHPEYRRRGIAKALMETIEQEARSRKRRLITLDTRTGDNAEPLYVSLGYRIVGVIPDYALNPTDDDFHSTTVMYKTL